MRLGEPAGRVAGTFDVAHPKGIHAVFTATYTDGPETLFCRSSGSVSAVISRWGMRIGLNCTRANCRRISTCSIPSAKAAGVRNANLSVNSFQGFVADYQRMDVAAYLSTSVADEPRQMAIAFRPSLVYALTDRQLRRHHQQDVDRGWEQ